jgi:hypothetical protein
MTKLSERIKARQVHWVEHYKGTSTSSITLQPTPKRAKHLHCTSAKTGSSGVVP